MTHGRGSWHTPIDVTQRIERRGDRDHRVRARLQVLKWPPGSDWSTENETGRSVPYVVIPAGNGPARKGALFGHIAPRDDPPCPKRISPHVCLPTASAALTLAAIAQIDQIEARGEMHRLDPRPDAELAIE